MEELRDDYNSKLESIETKYCDVVSRNEALSESIEYLKSKITELESVPKESEDKSPIVPNTDRLESFLSTLFPYMGKDTLRYISKNINNTSRMSRVFMKKFWNSVLILDLVFIIIQSKWPNLLNKINVGQWNKRLTTLRYCVEMVLIIQFGIAIHDFFNASRVDSITQAISNTVFTLSQTTKTVLRYVPSTLLVGSVVLIGTMLFKTRVLGEQVEWITTVKRLNVQ